MLECSLLERFLLCLGDVLSQLIALDYQSFLQEKYRNFAHLPGFVLLESTDKIHGRYDILSAYPYEQIRIRDDSQNKKRLLKQIQDKLVHIDSVSDLPFQGGAIGYISYDLGERLFAINSLPQPSLYDIPLLDLGLYDWAIISDHHLKKVTLFAANQHPKTQKLIPEMIHLWNKAVPSHPSLQIKTDFKPLISKSAYEESFWSIYRALKEGRAYQVNLTQAFHADYEGSAWEAYQKISTKNPVPFSAFLKTQEADVLSFSPERFLLYEQNTLLASPIKGTIARSSNPLEDEQLKQRLLSCTKNRAENVMIVDLLRNDLGKIAKPGTVQVKNLCAVHSYPSVHHLVSDITAVSDSYHPFELFLSCFPGGSITGAPKLESMRIINEQEPHARGIYCGSIGYFSHHGRFDTNIAIRTITAKNNILHLAAGGGIVIDSNCEDEYRECYTKIAAIVNGLQ